ncbi:hypothetical protein HK101_010056 [Irineochytrium annulatum]|nr:hypothetical protein HK101_010056 [Irineochytrium annulatum]
MIFGTFVGAVGILLVPPTETPTIEIVLNVFFAVTSLKFDGMVSDCPVPLRGIGNLMLRFVMPLMLSFYVSVIYGAVRLVQSRMSGAKEMINRITPFYLKGQPISMICLRAIITTLTLTIMPLTESALSMHHHADLLDAVCEGTFPDKSVLSNAGGDDSTSRSKRIQKSSIKRLDQETLETEASCSGPNPEPKNRIFRSELMDEKSSSGKEQVRSITAMRGVRASGTARRTSALAEASVARAEQVPFTEDTDIEVNIE